MERGIGNHSYTRYKRSKVGQILWGAKEKAEERRGITYIYKRDRIPAVDEISIRESHTYPIAVSD